MCGVYAEIRCGDLEVTDRTRGAVERLHHRGPDTRGLTHLDIGWCDVILGMTRLKIVDLSDIEVPYSFSGVVMAYNGEVYNWRQLRDELDGPWKTECDAEVVAAAWRQWGPECLDKMNGMWGLVLIDTWEKGIFIARDRAGEKPLYTAFRNGVRYVTSEIKALPFQLQESVCLDMNALEFDCGPSTPIKDVFAVEPGHCAHLEYPEDVEGLSTVCWWELPLVKPAADEDWASCYSRHVDKLSDLVVDAVKIRNVAEVPVAIQLSGGLDSAIIQSIVNSDRLYCVDFFEEGVNNIRTARKAAVNQSVRRVSFDREDLLDVLPQVAHHLDTPATWTAVCQWFMNQQIAQDGNVIVLSGEGADELFGGYARYRILWWLERMIFDPLLESYHPLMRRAGIPEDVLSRMLDRSGGEFQDIAQRLVSEHSDEEDLVRSMGRTDFYTTMQVLLRMADRMAAAFSLENRSPFLDYRIMEFSTTIPTSYKITERSNKTILRSVARRLGVHDDIIEEKTKKGLFVPSSWGAGAAWDRRWFRDAMQEAWRRSML